VAAALIIDQLGGYRVLFAFAGIFTFLGATMGLPHQVHQVGVCPVKAKGPQSAARHGKLLRGRSQQAVARTRERGRFRPGGGGAGDRYVQAASGPGCYDYYLGGKNHFAADRETAEKGLASWRSGRVAARENRAFLGRAVRFLATGAGIRQFLDIGTGLPTANTRPRGGAGSRAFLPGRLRRQRPAGPRPRRALLTSSPRGPHRLHQTPTCETRNQSCPTHRSGRSWTSASRLR